MEKYFYSDVDLDDYDQEDDINYDYEVYYDDLAEGASYESYGF